MKELFKEKYLHQVWLHRRFYPYNLKTSEGKSVEIISYGVPNNDAGPDFFGAQICIKEKRSPWRFYLSGNVEIHLTSDDWYRHHHDRDPAYNNVILHVVKKSTGREIIDSQGAKIDEIEINYPKNMDIPEAHELLCKKMFFCATDELKRNYLDKLFKERMEQWKERVESYYSYSGSSNSFNHDWDQVFFILLARSMGGNVNSEAMEMLARRTPIKIIFKQQNLLQSEALLLGQAGFLTDYEPKDDYEKELVREYEFLRAKYDLIPMERHMWKFLRMRPDNFPEIRLAQLSAMVTTRLGPSHGDFSPTDVMKMLENEPSSYWRNHYSLGKETTKEKSRQISKLQRELIIINAVAPFIYAYSGRYSGRATDRASATDRAIGDLDQVRELLQKIPPEKNRYIDQWAQMGITPRDEADAQALIYLSKNYCTHKKCFLCDFGKDLFAFAVTSVAKRLKS